MGFLVLLLLVFGIHFIVTRVRKRETSEQDREFRGRVGRTVHGMAAAQIQVPGLAGQTAADLVPQGPIRESVGPEESHTLVLDASGRPVTRDESDGPSDLGPYRDPDAPASAARVPRKRKAKAKKKPTA
jgi:hypothetical protein